MPAAATWPTVAALRAPRVGRGVQHQPVRVSSPVGPSLREGSHGTTSACGVARALKACAAIGSALRTRTVRAMLNSGARSVRGTSIINATMLKVGTTGPLRTDAQSHGNVHARASARRARTHARTHNEGRVGARQPCSAVKATMQRQYLSMRRTVCNNVGPKNSRALGGAAGAVRSTHMPRQSPAP